MPVLFKRRDVWKPAQEPKGDSRPASGKILLVLPFWNGDRAQMMALARLIADLEKSHSNTADILFVARFDTPQDPATVEYVARKFNIHLHTSSHRGVGWPVGCNGTMIGALDFLTHNLSKGHIPRYRAILLCEADCIPLARDWMSRLIQEWDRVNRMQPVRIAGALLVAGGKEHVNGGCAFLSSNLDFLNWLRNRMQRANNVAGWDWAFSSELKTKGWANIPSIVSHWRSGSRDIEATRALINAGIVLFHGVHDVSGIESVRALLL